MKIDVGNPVEVAKFAANVLQTHEHAVVVTSDNDQPWAVPVNRAYDQKACLVWKSAALSRHSKNLLNNPKASAVLFSNSPSNGDAAVFMEGHAKEVNNEQELKYCLEVRYELRGEQPPPIEDFLGDSPVRIYILEPTGIWITEAQHQKTEVGIELLKEELSNDPVIGQIKGEQ